MTSPSVSFCCPDCGDIKEMLTCHLQPGDAFVCGYCECVYHAPRGFLNIHPQLLRDNLLVTTMIKQGAKK